MRATFRRSVSPLSVRSPFADLDQMWRELDRWASPARRAPHRARLDPRPRVTQDEATGEWTLRAPLPGVSPEHLEVTVDEHVLIVQATVSAPEDAGFTVVHRERVAPSDRIRWALPKQAELDSIVAVLSDGWLEVRVRPMAKPAPRTIPVQSS
jgi:HSP20 family molecular chaperone IbpA